MKSCEKDVLEIHASPDELGDELQLDQMQLNMKKLSKSNPDREARQPKDKNKRNERKSIPRVQSTKYLPSNSVWFPGDARKEWKRPCFVGYDTVVLGDSQLKIYGRQQLKEPGWNIISYSGGDVSIISV